MKAFLIAAALLTLTACTTASPAVEENTALIGFSADSENVVVAEKVNGRAVKNGSYFQVSPGRNQLEVLVVSTVGEESTTSKFAVIEFSGFSAANIYKINVADRGVSKVLQLIDDNGTVLSESTI